MNNYFSFYGHKMSGLCMSLIILLIAAIASGCGDSGQTSTSDRPAHTASDSGTGSATFTVQWHDAVQLQEVAAVSREALDCGASGVADVACHVYDDAGALLVSGGPWPCMGGGARIDGIQVGQNRMFVVLAQDARGDVLYQGETSGVTIGSGITGVTIDAFPFVPDLLTPTNGDEQVDPTNISLAWTAVANADQYFVEVAQDVNFNTISFDEISPVVDPDNPSYMPMGLQATTTYFWRISAVDINSNIGGPSVVRSFSTSDCTSTIRPASSDTLGAGGGTYDVTVTTSLSICTWTASVPANAGWITLSPASGTDSGTVTVTIAANTGPTPRNATINIAGQEHTVAQDAPPDTTVPTVTITSPRGSTYNTNSSSLNIAGTAEDNVGVTTVTWANAANETSGTCSGTNSWSASGIQLAPGRNLITVTASDAAGNEGSDTLTVIYTPPDITDPTVTITSPADGSTYSASASLDIAGTADDNVAVTRVTWTNAANETSGTCSGTNSWSASGIQLVPGQNLITVTAMDAAQNTGSATLTVTYRILPDYRITELVVNSEYIYAGTAVDFSSTIENQGGAPTTETCINIGYYLSTDATITTSDILLETGQLNPCNLASGGTYSWRMSVKIPDNLVDGYYYIGIIADYDQKEPESNEGNNTNAAQIYVSTVE